MRNPARIDEIFKELEIYWKKRPDMRLSQIIMNAYGRPGDPYQFKDDELLIKLKEWNKSNE